MKKNGFISLTLIYSFFVLFLLLMLFLLNSYISTRFSIEQYKRDIGENFIKANNSDINLYVYVWDRSIREYKFASTWPRSGYDFQDISYCTNGSTITYSNGKVHVAAKERETCYAYFK